MSNKRRRPVQDEDVMADESWPVMGSITRVSANCRVLYLNRTSSLFHVGMFLVPREYEPDGNYDSLSAADLMEVADVDGNVVTLVAPAPKDIDGSSFFTLPRVTPDNPADFNRVDCIQLLHALHKEYKSEEFLEDRKYRLEIMRLPMEDDGTPEVMLAAYQSVLSNMNILQERCLQHGLYNGRGAVEEKVTRMLNEVRTIQNRMFEAEYSLRGLERASRSSVPISADDRYQSLWNYDASVQEKRSDNTEILEYFLRVAYNSQMRHRGGNMYERILTTVDAWKPLSDNPLCTSMVKCQSAACCFGPDETDGRCEEHRQEEVGERRPAGAALCCDFRRCQGLACFAPGAGGGSGHRARCQVHRQESDVDDRLVEEDGVMRIHEDERRSSVQPTQAWRPLMEHGGVMSINTWLHRHVDQFSQSGLWNKLISSYGKVVSTCVSYMTQANHSLFPEFAPDPKKFSFQNGVYDIRTNRFYAYGTQEVPDCCCVNHIDEYFDQAWVDMPVHTLTVPGYDQIVASQDYTPEVRQWLDVFLGRLFFAVGEFDRWEKFLVIKGYAATGKSTIAKAIVKLFGASNVGNIPANCEEQWALASVHGKRVWLCTELKKDWRFPTAVLQSMISGEVVPVHVKHQTAVDIEWTIQGAAFGNEEPTAWQNDTMNALHRRVILLPFDVAPKTQDPTIQKKFMKNTGRFLVRLVRTYLAVAMQHAAIDELLPARLKAARSEFLRRTQPLIRFLDESADIVLASAEVRRMIQDPPPAAGEADPAAPAVKELRLVWRMRMSELMSRFKDWWIENNLGKVVPSITSKSVYGAATTHLNLSVERDPEERQDYMYGVKPLTTMRAGHADMMFGYRGGEGAGCDS